jgi:hypothetical protein
MSYKGYYNTDTISKILNIPSIGNIWIDTSHDDEWNCYDDSTRKLYSKVTAFYWNNLSEEDRKLRLKNHGMTGKKHSTKTREKMSKSAIGTTKPSLHKGGTVVSPTGEIVHFKSLRHFCKEQGLSVSHVSELMSGKRKSVKGWKNGTSL